MTGLAEAACAYEHELLAQPFEAVFANRADAEPWRNFVNPSADVEGWLSFFGLAMCDREAMLAMLRSIGSGGDDQVSAVLERLRNLSENASTLAAMVGSVEARAMIVAHQVFGLTFRDTSPEDDRSALFEVASRVYREALATRDAHDQAHLATGEISGEDWIEAERLAGALSDAEDALMGIPSPTAEAFVLKYQIAHGGGRETDCWNAMLDAEAAQFIGSGRPS